MSEGFTERLVARAALVGLSIDSAYLAPLQTYAELLAHWNQRINLTAMPLAGWPDSTLDRLILESVAAAPLVSGLSGKWVDLGSGGGSPALPVAILSAGLDLTLTESRGKKAAFLREAVRAIPVPRATVVGRFEELMEWPAQSVALITCRAVHPDQAVEIAEHLLSQAGRMLYFGSAVLPQLGTLQLIDNVPLPGGSHLSIFAR